VEQVGLLVMPFKHNVWTWFEKWRGIADQVQMKGDRKEDWETSMIIGIPEKTVGFYVNLIRSKLGAVNTTHAVTKAYNENILIGPP